MFWSAGQLYGLGFKENTGKVPVFDPDVRTFEVTDQATGKVVGVFYFDAFARDGKRSGAWMTTYRSRSKLLGDNIVLASNNNNFTKRRAGQAGADQPRRCGDPVPRVRPRHPLSAVNVRYPSLGGLAARLRRISEPGERELAADAGGARRASPSTTDRRSRCRRRWSTRSRRRRRSTRASPRSNISSLGDGRHEAAHRPRRRGRSGRVREGDAGAKSACRRRS